MQVKNKIFCHWDLVRFVSELELKKANGTFLTLSIIGENQRELMIFLGKDDSNSCYEVRVYKNEPSDKYVPNEHDKISHYEENDEYATFFFHNYKNAHSFVETLGYLHPEYIERPTREIGKEM